jgi:outer membrane protein assembly factor BamB
MFIVCFNHLLYPGKIITLNEVLEPYYISVSSDRIYIAERTSVIIYSIKDFTFIKRAGRRGVGPGEFQVIMGITSGPGYVTVSGPGRICFFNSNGDNLRELKSTTFSTYFAPIGDKFVSSDTLDVNKIGYYTINIFDSKLTKGKELCRYKRMMQRSGSFNPIKTGSDFFVSENIIFINGEDDHIHCYNENGEKIRSIKIDSKYVKITGEFKKRYINYLKNHRKLKIVYEMYKNRIRFPGYFPLIKYFRVADKRIYVITHQKKDHRHECLVLNFMGKVLYKTFLTIRFKSLDSPYPFDIKNNKFYQIVEDDEEETNRLYIDEIAE